MNKLFHFLLLIFLFNCMVTEAERARVDKKINKEEIPQLKLKSFINKDSSIVRLEWNKLKDANVYNLYIFIKASKGDSYKRHLLGGSLPNTQDYYNHKLNEEYLYPNIRTSDCNEEIFYQIEATLNTGKTILSNKKRVINENSSSNKMSRIEEIIELPKTSKEVKEQELKNIEHDNFNCNQITNLQDSLETSNFIENNAPNFSLSALNIPSDVALLKEKAFHFNIFKFRETIKGFEIYNVYAEPGSNCDIACLNEFDELLLFINQTNIERPNIPIEVYPYLKNKNPQELTINEKKLKRCLNLEKGFRERGSEYADIVNVIPKDTKFILIKIDDQIYIQKIEKLDTPRIIKSYCDTSSVKFNRRVSLFVKWESIEGAKDYKIIIKNAAKQNTIAHLVQTNQIRIEVEIDPNEENEFNILKLTALSDEFESYKTSGDIEMTSTIEKFDPKVGLRRFLSKYNAILNPEVEEELLSLPAIRKGKVDFNNDDLDFSKVLVLSLCDNLKLKVKNINTYSSEELDRLLKREIRRSDESDKQIYKYLLNSLRTIYKKASDGLIELIKNEDHPEYTINDYIFNCALGVASAFSLIEIEEGEELKNNPFIREIIEELEINGVMRANRHISGSNITVSSVTLLNDANKKTIKNYCRDIYFLLKNENSIEDSENYFKLFIEGFSNCVPGMLERLAYISNSLYLKQNKNENQPQLEEIIENILLEFREELFKRNIMGILEETNIDVNENVMYMNWVRKGVSKGLKLFPAEENEHLMERTFLRNGLTADRFYEKFIKNFKTTYYDGIIEKVEMEFNSDKERIIPMFKYMLRQTFLYLENDEESTSLFFTRNLIKKDIKNSLIITQNLIKALLLKKGVLAI